MTLFIERTYKEKVTLSEIEARDNGEAAYSCKGLELPWKNNQRRISCIPEGMYIVKKRISPKYGNHFHLQKVTGRDWILIHHGNYTRDILGCILVGRTHTDIDRDGITDVTHSKATMKELNELLPKEFTVIIYKKGADPSKLVF